MGYGNVKAVYGVWGDLPDGAFRLLAYMALIAKDEDDPPRFYGGRETLAYALGWAVEDKRTTDPVEIAKREQAFKSVHRTLGILKKAGAITTLVAAAPGRTAEYGLNLTVLRSPKNWSRSRQRLRKNGDHSGPSGTPETVPADGNASKSLGGTPPKESAERLQISRQMVPQERGPQEKEEQEKTREEEVVAVSTTSHPPRASPPDAWCPKHPKLRLKPRTDGRTACGFCRREQRAGPDNPEPATNVIDLDSRRTA